MELVYKVYIDCYMLCYYKNTPWLGVIESFVKVFLNLNCHYSEKRQHCQIFMPEAKTLKT